MSNLASSFGTAQIGSIIPGAYPGNKKYLICDGAAESVATNANKHLGVMYPRLTTAQTKQFSSSSLRSVLPFAMAIGNGVFVVVGSVANTTTTCILTSTDGRKWVRREISSTALWRTVVWTGEYFLAAGDDNSSSGGVVARSEDGVNWTQVHSVAALVTNLWTYNGQSLVRFNDGTFYRSMDGVNWTAATSNLVPAQVVWFKNYLWTNYNSSNLYRSDNGLNWESSQAVSSLVSLDASPTTIVAASQTANQTRYSTDGVTWTTAVVPGLKRVIWNGENFIGFGTGTVSTYYTSADGITWSAAKNLTIQYGSLQDVQVNLTTKEVYFWTAAGQSVIYRLTPTWGNEIVPLLGSTYTVNTMIHTGSMFILGGTWTSGVTTYPLLATSTDGINWTQVEMFSNQSSGSGVTSIAQIGNVLVAAIPNTQNYGYSADGGLTWLRRNTLPNNSSGKVVANGTLFMTYLSNSSTSYYTSSDGITWTSRTAAQNIYGMGVCGDTFGITYDNFSVVVPRYSTDGINWTVGSSIPTGFTELVSFKDTTWLAYLPAGNNISVYSAPKTMTAWTSRTLGQQVSATTKFMSSATTIVAYSSGTDAAYSTSTDGFTWTARGFENLNQSWYAGAYNPLTTDFLLMNSSCAKITRSQTFAKWSFAATWGNFTDSMNQVQVSSVKTADKVITEKMFKLDSDQYWRWTFLPLHGSMSLAGMIAANDAATAFVGCSMQNVSSNWNISLCDSTNGLEWTLNTLLTIPVAASRSDLRVSAILHDGTNWYVFFNSYFYLRSADGKNWTRYGCPFSVVNSSCVAAGNGKLVVMPEKGTFVSSIYQLPPSEIADYYVSSDGLNWTKYKCPFKRAMYVAYGPTLGFMMISAVADESKFSLDGVTWGQSYNFSNGLYGVTVSYFYGFKCTGGMYVAYTNNGLLSTKDGVTWSARYANNSGTYPSTVSYLDGSNILTHETTAYSGNTMTTNFYKVDTSVIRAPALNPANVPSYALSLVIG